MNLCPGGLDLDMLLAASGDRMFVRKGEGRGPAQLPAPHHAGHAEALIKAAAEQEYQLAELSRSITFCRDTLGLGVRD
ncbi:MAG: hypothetical protein WD072_01235 [Pirellulales bacterium]